MVKRSKDILPNQGLAIAFIAIATVALFCTIQIVRISRSKSSPSEESRRKVEIRVYVTRDDAFFRDIADDIEDDLGILLRTVVCRSAAASRKVLSEASLAAGTVDLLILEEDRALISLREAQAIQKRFPTSISDSLSILNPINDGFVPLYISRAGLVYDAVALPNPPRDWDSFNRFINENPGRFGFTAVESPAGFSFLQSLHAGLLSEHNNNSGDGSGFAGLADLKAWFEKSGKDVILTNSDYDALRLLATGKLLIASAVEDEVLRASRDGRIHENIDMYIPDFGSSMTTIGMAMPLNTQNEEPVLALMEYLLDRDNQLRMREMLMVAPVRPGMAPPIGSLLGDYWSDPHFLPQLDGRMKAAITEQFRKEILYGFY